MATYQANPASTVPGLRLVDGNDIATLVAFMNVSPGPQSLQLAAASGAIAPGSGATVFITDGAAAALTLAAPTINGQTITFISTTAYAHTVTSTGLLNNGSANVNVGTFAAHPGASLSLVGYGGAWYVLAQQAITFS